MAVREREREKSEVWTFVKGVAVLKGFTPLPKLLLKFLDLLEFLKTCNF
jgi:hypothetical protein